jgi:hypothetical protein
MIPPDESPPATPTPGEIADLKRLADGIIRDQGNRFIKELLRDKKIRIGDTKEDFSTNLNNAIESGELRLTDVAKWLESVEGWGNQHVYLYNISTTLRRDLTKPRIGQRVEGNAVLKNVWNAPTVLAFPDDPKLTSISFSDSVLRLVWQEASPAWTHVSEKDYSEEEGLDTYKYEAWRKVERRAITRFEAHLDKGLAGLFIPGPIEGSEHQAAIDEARRVIELLMDLPALERGQLDISVVSRNLDQQNLPNNATPKPVVKTRKSRLTSGGAYVEFAASSPDKAFWEETAIRNVRNSVRTAQLRAFQGTEGGFIFQAGSDRGDLKRPLRVQLYAKANRIRLWAQMDVDEVWVILGKINTYQ